MMSMISLDDGKSNTSQIHSAAKNSRGNVAFGSLEIVLFVAGCFINTIAYGSAEPTILAVFFLIAGLGSLRVTPANSFYEQKIFLRTFAVGWFMAGIAAVYANILLDTAQLYSDAGGFYDLASGKSRGLTLDQIRALTEGSGAVLLWRAVYAAFAAIGFDKGRYVGVLVNVSAVALTGVIAIKMARQIYGEDCARFRRLSLIFAWCGLFWLFAAIHMRDGVILLAVSLLAYAWVIFLSRPGAGLRLVYFSLANLAAIAGLGYLRNEFAFVPVAMAFSGMAAFMFGRKKKRNSITTLIIFALAFVVLVGLLAVFNAQLVELLVKGGTDYTGFSVDSHGEGSLGMTFVVNQPLPVKLVVGSVYLFIFPIPFWSGFQLESAYQVFKSANVIFFYFFTPLLLLSVWKLWKVKTLRTYGLLFLFFCSLGFTLAIAVTSLETRHFGAFLAPMFVLALLPDLQNPTERAFYQKLLFLFVGAIFTIHTLWAILKFA